MAEVKEALAIGQEWKNDQRIILFLIMQENIELDDELKDKIRVVAGVGSGGTITGVGRYLRKVSPQTSIVAADPIGSVIKDAVKTGSYKYEGGSWFVEGIGEDFIPNNCDLEVIDDAISVSDKGGSMEEKDLVLLSQKMAVTMFLFM